MNNLCNLIGFEVSYNRDSLHTSPCLFLCCFSPGTLSNNSSLKLSSNKSTLQTALQNSKHKKHDQLSSVRGMAVGMYVKLDSKVGNKSINICPSLDLYKIKEISDCKMSVTLLEQCPDSKPR